MLLHLRIVHTNQFLVEGDRQRRLTTEFCHIGPLPCLDGLFDAMDGVLREEFEFVECFLEGEGTVGIEPQFHLMELEPLSDALHQVEFLFEVDGTNLQFHTTETLLQFLFHALQHLLIVAHPYEPIDGDAYLTTTERRIKKPVTSFQIQKCRFESEKHRGIVAEFGNHRQDTLGTVPIASLTTEVCAHLI